jgi:hypothetical protein
MPHLIQGHLRFTEDDFLIEEYQLKTEEKTRSTTYANLVALLKNNSERLELMRDKEIIQHFNTEKNIKSLLAHSLGMIAGLAAKEGYTLTDLMRL